MPAPAVGHQHGDRAARAGLQLLDVRQRACPVDLVQPGELELVHREVDLRRRRKRWQPPLLYTSMKASRPLEERTAQHASSIVRTLGSLTRKTPTNGDGVFFSAIMASTSASSVTTSGAMKPGKRGRRWIGTASRLAGFGAFSPARRGAKQPQCGAGQCAERRLASQPHQYRCDLAQCSMQPCRHSLQARQPT